MTHSLFLSNFQDACRTSRCPFCVLSEQDTKHYVSTLLHEYTLAPDIHVHLLRSKGLCARHASLLVETAEGQHMGGLGVATLYENLLQDLVEQLQALATDQPRVRPPRNAKQGWPLGVALEPQETCLVCVHEAQNEHFVARELVEDVAENGDTGGMAAAYMRSAGACIPHLRLLVQYCRDAAVVEWLGRVQERCLVELFRRLRSCIQSYDASSPEAPEGDRSAWRDVVEAVSGSKRLAPWLQGQAQDRKALNK